MRLRSIRLVIALLIFALNFVTFRCIPAYAYESSPEGMELVAQNSNYTLYVNMENGEFAVKNKGSGFIWWSNPKDRDEDKIAKGIFKMNLFSQMIVQYIESDKDIESLVNNYTGSVRSEGAKIEKIENGFKAVYEFHEEKFAIPLEVSLEEDFLRAEIKVDEIKESGKNLVSSIELLPYFGAGGLKDEGYMFVPDGSGALIYFNNGKQKYGEYSEKIYGWDRTFVPRESKVVKESIRLPVFGIKNGGDAILGVITQGDAHGYINASVSRLRKSYNNAYAKFEIRASGTYVIGDYNDWNQKEIRTFEKEKPRLDSCEIRYYFLSGEEANYSGMAKAYREFLIGEKGLREQTEDISPLYIDLYGAIIKKKSILGIPFNVTLPLTTYNEAQKIVEQLKAEGIDDLVVRYNNWIKEEINDKVPAGFSLERKLGGTRGFKNLVDYLNKNSINFYPNVDFINFSESGRGISKFSDVARTLKNMPTIQYAYKLSTYIRDDSKKFWYLLLPVKMREVIERYTSNSKRYEISNVSLASIGEYVYSDYSSQPSSLQETEAVFVHSLQTMKKGFESIMVNGGNAYTFTNADHIIGLPVESSYFDIEDETIPFIQMVLKGLISYAVNPINFSDEPEMLYLKAIETGSQPLYTWIYRDSSLLKDSNYAHLYGTDYKVWIKTAIKHYREIKEMKKCIGTSTIQSHRQIQKGVFETVYENGCRVIVNYNTNNVLVDSINIEARNYIFLAGG